MKPLVVANGANDPDRTKIVLTWAEPSSCNGSPCTKYEIRIKKKGVSNDDFRPADSLCNGADATVIAKRSCTIVSSVLKDQWGYVAGDLFVGDIRAYNTWGWGGRSEPNTKGDGGTVFKLVPFNLTRGRKLNGNQ